MTFRKIELLFFIPIMAILFFGYQYYRFSIQTPSKMSFYSLEINTLDGNKISFADFKGKYILVVNTASECGYTPQYEDLQQLHEMHREHLVIIGFPANNFGSQEPGSNQQIAQFCQKNYGVTFLMAEKSSVVGKDQNQVYQWLTNPSKNGWNAQVPTWNFCKYLIDAEGKLLKFFPQSVHPFDEAITDLLPK